MRNEWIINITLIVLSIITIICIRIEYRRRKSRNAPGILRPEDMFELSHLTCTGICLLLTSFESCSRCTALAVTTAQVIGPVLMLCGSI
jgi:hypothetical protein